MLTIEGKLRKKNKNIQVQIKKKKEYKTILMSREATCPRILKPGLQKVGHVWP